MNPAVDFYFLKEEKWKKEVAKLRTILLDCGLDEVLKWGVPCYQYAGKNTVLIHTFKKYCAVLFFKGALLADPEDILVQQTKNVQAARQMRFTSLQEVLKRRVALTAYVHEAIALEKSGAKMPLKKTEEFDMPVEFEEKLQRSRKLKAAFESLSPGRQRAYLLHFSSAKQAKTREARIEKYLPRILESKGMDD